MSYQPVFPDGAAVVTPSDVTVLPPTNIFCVGTGNLVVKPAGNENIITIAVSGFFRLPFRVKQVRVGTTVPLVLSIG